MTAVTDQFARLQKVFPDLQKVSLDTDLYLRQALQWIIQNLGNVFSGVAKFIASAFICFLALFYMLRDGQKLKETVVVLSPLSDTDDRAIFKKLEASINSVIRGNLLIGLIQGTLVATGFAIFGVPNPILWGTVGAIAALIPAIGTAVVLIPGIAFLLFTGHDGAAIGLLAWGLCAVGLIDNVLGPKLLSHKTKLHPLVVLISVLGGIGFFGPVGFIVGPLAVSFFFALLDIYFTSIKERA